MAITWDVQITVLDYNQKHVSVMGTRTDSSAPQDARVYTIGPRHINTAAQRSAVLDEIWAMRTADVTLDNKKAAFAPTVANLEAAAKTNLEVREV